MDSEEPTDADLVARTLAGDREAFGCLYDRHARLVRAVVGGVSWDGSAVEDMTQECFLRAYRMLDRLRDRQRFAAWLVGIARQVARERKRALRRDRHEFVGQVCAEFESGEDGKSDSHAAEQLERLARKLAELPERERLAINLFFLNERNANQAAELLQLSRSGLYALLQRAVARLAALVRTPEQAEEEK